MERIANVVALNRLPLAIGALSLLIAALTFEVVIGLSAAVAAGLMLLVVAATLAVYRMLTRSPVSWDEPLRRRRLATSALVALALIGVLIQGIPYGWDRTNPPVTGEPSWDSARTRELTVRACFDCHSNEVVYPWYSQVAPVSWAVALHVEQGRAAVNYSEWDRPQRDADASAKTVIKGEMPPSYYALLTHADARLTDAELEQLIRGLEATFGSEDD